MATLLQRMLTYLGLRNGDTQNVIEVAAKSATVFVGVSYVIGLFVVNFYLARYGVRGLGLLRVDFVLAGATWLLLFLLSWMLWRNVLGPLLNSQRSWLRRIGSMAG